VRNVQTFFATDFGVMGLLDWRGKQKKFAAIAAA
jgi:hypothetical protein